MWRCPVVGISTSRRPVAVGHLAVAAMAAGPVASLGRVNGSTLRGLRSVGYGLSTFGSRRVISCAGIVISCVDGFGSDGVRAAHRADNANSLREAQ